MTTYDPKTKKLEFSTSSASQRADDRARHKIDTKTKGSKNKSKRGGFLYKKRI